MERMITAGVIWVVAAVVAGPIIGRCIKGNRTPLEQAAEDAEQAEYLRAWQRKQEEKRNARH